MHRASIFTPRVKRALLAAFLAFGLNATAAAYATAADIVIGFLNGLTGPGADLGTAGMQGIQRPVDEINAAGGIGGRKVRVVYRDDEGNPQKAVAAVQELIHREGANIIMGANLTHVAFAIAPIINQAQIPFITFASGTPLIDPAKFPYSFRTNASNAVEAAAFVDYAVKQGGFKKPGIIVDATALGQSGELAIRAALKKFSIEPVAAETFKLSDTDVTGQVSKLRDAGADVMLVWGIGGPLAYVARAAKRIDFQVPVFANLGANSSPLTDLAGDALQNWKAANYRAFSRSETEPAPQRVRDYVEYMQKTYGRKMSHTVEIAALWEDTMHLVFEALKGAKAIDGPSIKQALESGISYSGMISEYSFGPNKHDAFNPKDITVSHVLGVKDFVRPRPADAP